MHHRPAIAAAAAALLAIATASSASAATSDDTHTGYSVEWFTGALTTIADNATYTIGSHLAAPAEVVAFDLDAEGNGYATSHNDSSLHRISSTAAPELIGTLTYEGFRSDCRGFDYSDGALTASCKYAEDRYMLAAVDTATAALTMITTIPAETAAIARDPQTGHMWLFGHLGGLWIYDGTTATSVQLTGRAWGADFDSAGRLWVTPNQLDAQVNGRDVISVVPQTDDWFESVSVISTPAADPTPTPDPALAETGTDSGWLVALGAGAVIAGALVFALRAIRRPDSSTMD